MTFVGFKGKRLEKSETLSATSKISTKQIEAIIERLKANQMRDSMVQNYLCIWRQFNNFLIRLDRRLKLWEDKAQLFVAHLIEHKAMQSSMIRSYVSAIKHTLLVDGYEWDDNKILLSRFTKACKISNDRARIRLPIHCGLLELILFEVDRLYSVSQPYLQCLYKTIFTLGHYGLMRIGELTKSNHILLACNIHIATNKEKILLVLYSSKMHDEGNKPQKIKIVSNRNE